MKEFNTKKILKIGIPLLVALISIFVLTDIFASPTFHAKTIESLDNKKVTVMELTAASTAASAALSAIPGDAATPIAEKLADLSSNFLIVLSAIYLEKYLVTITGYASFTLLIPLACGIFIINEFLNKEALMKVFYKLLILAIAIFLVIPTSVKVSDIIENTYSISIQETLEDAKNTTEVIEEETNSENSGIISGIISGVSNISKTIENTLNNFIEALAVMLVTSCVIPIVVLFFFAWIVKLLLGIDIHIPTKRITQK